MPRLIANMEFDDDVNADGALACVMLSLSGYHDAIRWITADSAQEIIDHLTRVFGLPKASENERCE